MLMLSSCYLYVLLENRDTFNAALLSVSGQALAEKNANWHSLRTRILVARIDS